MGMTKKAMVIIYSPPMSMKSRQWHLIFFYVLKPVPIYFSCLGEYCNSFFAVKLDKYFMDYETSPGFHRHGVEQKMTEFHFWDELIP